MRALIGSLMETGIVAVASVDMVSGILFALPRSWLSAVLLVLLTLVAYAPAMRAGWIWDDDYYVTKNENLCDFRGLVNIWTKLGLPNGGTPQYYPVTHTTFWMENHLWGDRAAGYHVVNILLHAASVVMLWVLLNRLQVPGAWFIAAVFAVHPVHVESVAWVTERKNVLSGFFYFAAMVVYLNAAPLERSGEGSRVAGGDPKPRWWLYGFSLVLFIAALLSKSVTASLPAAVLLIVWWKHARVTSRDVKPLVPFFLAGVAMGMLTSYVERHYVIVQRDWDLSFVQRVLIAGRAVWFYAWKLIWPGNLSFIYPRWDVDPRTWWQWSFPVATVAGLMTFWSLRPRIGRGPLVALLFFMGTLFPALGFVDVFPMRYSFVADHFQYLASIGLIALIVSWLAVRTRVVPIIVIVILGVLTFRRAMVFDNHYTLWPDTIAKNPNGWMPRNNFGNVLMADGKLDAAETQFVEALKHNPHQPELLINLGAVLERRGRWPEAIGFYERALKRRPDDTATAARLHLDRGMMLASGGNFEAAAVEFRAAVERDPSMFEGWNNLGVALEKLNDTQGAMRAYERALQANPQFEKARRNLEKLRLAR
jgi:protein O-mannosyl-transferase